MPLPRSFALEVCQHAFEFRITRQPVPIPNIGADPQYVLVSQSSLLLGRYNQLATNRKRIEEVQGMQKNINDYRQQAVQDLQKKEIDLFRPILEKAKGAIQKVARAKGYVYVLDSSEGNGVILADGKDLLADVKTEMGI